MPTPKQYKDAVQQLSEISPQQTFVLVKGLDGIYRVMGDGV